MEAALAASPAAMFSDCMELQAVEQVPRVADLDPADCRRRAEQHFSAAAMTAGYVAVYDKLTAGAASRKQ